MFFAGRPRSQILIEASTESEWVAQHLETLGHDVIVADPTYAPMYATRARRVKTDKRDARTLAEACRLKAFRPAHRVSPARGHVRAELAVREALVRTRTRYIALAKAFVRRDGLRVRSGESRSVAERIAAPDLSPRLADELRPLFEVLPSLNAQITACAVVATAGEIARVTSAHHFEAFLGLVPSERSSGDKRRIGRITKAGNTRVRYLLVEAAWRILRSKRPETAALRGWALTIAARRGKRVAVVALARRLAGILYAMWRDNRPYDPTQLRMPRPKLAATGYARDRQRIEMTESGVAGAVSPVAARESR